MKSLINWTTLYSFVTWDWCFKKSLDKSKWLYDHCYVIVRHARVTMAMQLGLYALN